MVSGSSNNINSLPSRTLYNYSGSCNLYKWKRNNIFSLCSCYLYLYRVNCQEYKWERTTLSLPNAQITTHLILLQWLKLQYIQVERAKSYPVRVIINDTPYIITVVAVVNTSGKEIISFSCMLLCLRRTLY